MNNIFEQLLVNSRVASKNFAIQSFLHACFPKEQACGISYSSMMMMVTSSCVLYMKYIMRVYCAQYFLVCPIPPFFIASKMYHFLLLENACLHVTTRGALK